MVTVEIPEVPKNIFFETTLVQRVRLILKTRSKKEAGL